jgi:predicted aspartyl protease
MRSVNYTRLEDYRNALADGILFIRKYGHLYDSAFIAETRDDNLVREALAGVPKLQTTISSDVEIPVQRDKAGLINVPVIVGNDSVSFVFDSGASMSVITSSLTAKYGIQPLNKKIFVMAITGKRIEAQLALVNLKMGNIEIRNSPFIVFPDSVLSFGDVYSIRGIIGFPVMNSLGEFILKNDQSIVFPKIPETATSRNFALDQATPVILVKYQQDTLPFHFDTGAMQSMLYSSFFNRYKDTITNNFQKKISHLGGAGGILELDAFVLPTAVFSAGNVQNSLDSLRILTKPLISTQEKFYGNLGQDFMKNYKEMKVNFKAMNISFADKK